MAPRSPYIVSAVSSAQGERTVMINGHHSKKEISLQEKVELLEKSVEEVQKYELLTTNQYLQKMELVLEILQDIS